MVIHPELLKVSTALATQVAKKSSIVVWDKIKAIKEKGEDKETIKSLENIILELIDDKNELIQIAQAYEEELITQKLSDEDMAYIANCIIPIIEELIQHIDKEEADKAQETINTIKPILSKETFNILQLLGFNFIRAIGEPLTELINAYIKSQIPSNSNFDLELAILQEQRNVQFLKIIQDTDAYERYSKETDKDT